MPAEGSWPGRIPRIDYRAMDGALHRDGMWGEAGWQLRRQSLVVWEVSRMGARAATAPTRSSSAFRELAEQGVDQTSTGSKLWRKTRFRRRPFRPVGPAT